MSELSTLPRSAHPGDTTPWPPPPTEPPPDRRRLRGLLLPIQLFLAAGWLRAGVEKIISGDWWTGAELDRFLVEQQPHMIDFFPAIVDVAIAPLALPISWIVMAMQVLIGVALLTGRRIELALWGGVLLNTTFVLAGAVNPSAFYLMMQLVLLLALAPRVAWRTSVARAVAWFAAAAAMVPFVRTVDPALVIDDPASMLAFAAALTGVGIVATGEWYRVPALARRFGDERTLERT